MGPFTQILEEQKRNKKLFTGLLKEVQQEQENTPFIFNQQAQLPEYIPEQTPMDPSEAPIQQQPEGISMLRDYEDNADLFKDARAVLLPDSPPEAETDPMRELVSDKDKEELERTVSLLNEAQSSPDQQWDEEELETAERTAIWHRDKFTPEQLNYIKGQRYKQWKEEMKEKGPKGFAESFDPSGAVPFNPVKALETGRIAYLTYKALQDDVSTDEKVELARYLQKAEEDSIRGRTFWGHVANILSQLPGYALEFAGTGGLYTAGRKAGRKAALKLTPAALRKALGKKVSSATVRTAGALAGTAARTAAMPHRIAENTARRMSARQMGVDKEGEFTVVEAGDTLAKALAKGTADTYIENLSEISGEALGKVAGAVISKIPMTSKLGRLIAKLPAQDLIKTVDKGLKKIGYHGPLEEMGEERFGDLLRAITGLQGWGDVVPEPKQLAAEGVAFAIPGVTAQAAGQVYGTARKRKDKKRYKEFLNSEEGAQFAQEVFPEEAKQIAEKEKPSRKDMRDIGATGWNQQERVEFAEKLRKTEQDAAEQAETKKEIEVNREQQKPVSEAETTKQPPKPPAEQQQAPETEAETAEIDTKSTGEQIKVKAYKGMLTTDWETGKPITEFKSKNGPWAGFFTSDKKVADGFKDSFSTMGEADTYEVEIEMNNPLVFDAKGKPAKEFMFDNAIFDQKANNIKALKAFDEGHDGIIIKNTEDEADVYIPKDNSQIKRTKPPSTVAEAETVEEETKSDKITDRPDIQPGPKPGPFKLDPQEQRKGTALSPIGIIKRIEKMFDVPIRQQRIGNKLHAGIYKRMAGVIRLQERYANDLAIASHEVAHHLDRTTDILKKGMTTPMRKELQRLDYQPTKARTSEGFAEFIRFLLTNEEAQSKAPKFYDHFIEWLEKNPKVKKRLEQAHNLITRWQTQGALKRAKGALSFTGKPETPTEQPWIESAKDRLWMWTQKYYSAMKDEGHFLNLFVKAARAAGYTAASGKSPYDLYLAFNQTGPTLANKAIEEGVYKLSDNLEQIGPSLKDVFKDIKTEEYENFVIFAYSRHAVEAWKKGQNPGISFEDAKYNYQNLYTENWEKAAKTLTDFNNALIDMLHSAGVIDADAANNIKNSYKTYLPLMRVKQKGAAGQLRSAKKYVDSYNPLHKRSKEGSGRTVIDPVQSTVERAVRFYERASQQIVLNEMVRMARKVKGLGPWIEKVPPQIKGTKFTMEEIKPQLEAVNVDVDTLLEEADIGEEDALFIWRPDYKGSKGEHIARVFIDGKPQLYQLHPEMYRSLAGMNYFNLPWYFDMVFGKITRTIKLGATGINVAFGERNTVKDYITYLVQSKESPKAALDALPTGMLRTYIWSETQNLLGKEGDPIVDLYQMMGGELTHQLGLDRRKIQKTVKDVIADSAQRRTINAVKNPIDLTRKIIGVTEVGPRLAEFKNTLKRHGYTRKRLQNMMKQGVRPPRAVLVEAINRANDVTTNFKRLGWMGKWLNRMIPYFNAPLEGTDKYIRTWKDQPVRAFTFSSAYAAARIWYWTQVKDEDWYKEAPPWLKYGFWTITNPDGKPIIRVPIPHLWGIGVGGGVEAILNRINEKDPEAIKQWLAETAKETGVPLSWQDITPSLAKQGLEVAMNKDFFRDRPIVYDFPKKEPYMQYTDYTTDLSKAVFEWLYEESGGAVNISPAKAEHFANSITGGLVRNVVKPAEAITQGKKLAEGDNPLTGAFALRRDYSQSLTEFYESSEDYTRKYNSAKEKGQMPKHLEINYHLYESYKDLMTQLRNASKKVEGRDEKFEYNKYIIGLARYAQGKEPLDRYPNPLKEDDLPKPAADIIDGWLGDQLYRMTKANNENQIISRGEKIIRGLGLEYGQARAILAREARRRGYKTNEMQRGKYGYRKTSFGKRVDLLKKRL